uniref:Uncharacterized protein n=1 Tax=Oryza punctata TaxID=4537 RepID=A0A0E0KHT7_ORYPU
MVQQQQHTAAGEHRPRKAAKRALCYGPAAAAALKPKQDVDAAAAPFSQAHSVKRRYDDFVSHHASRRSVCKYVVKCIIRSRYRRPGT